MDETDGTGMEGDAAVGVGPGRTVLEIALDGAADVCELAADLVMPSGHEFHLDEMVALRAFQVHVSELRLLGFMSRPFCDEGFVQFLVAGHPVGKEGRCGFGLAAAESPVGLVDVSVPEHRIQAFQGFGGLCEEDESAYRTVQAVGDAHEYLSRLPVPQGDERLERFAQRFVAGLVALDDFARPLVEDEQVVVLVEDAVLDVMEFLVVELPVDHRCHGFPQR